MDFVKQVREKVETMDSTGRTISREIGFYWLKEGFSSKQRLRRRMEEGSRDWYIGERLLEQGVLGMADCQLM
jgi:hypothetical protein